MRTLHHHYPNHPRKIFQLFHSRLPLAYINARHYAKCHLQLPKISHSLTAERIVETLKYTCNFQSKPRPKSKRNKAHEPAKPKTLSNITSSWMGEGSVFYFESIGGSFLSVTIHCNDWHKRGPHAHRKWSQPTTTFPTSARATPTAIVVRWCSFLSCFLSICSSSFLFSVWT